MNMLPTNHCIASRRITIACPAVALAALAGCASAPRASLTADDYLDKCRGALAGQIIGVSYGAPYEFNYVGKIQDDPIRPWKPEFIENGFSQDDLYVEVTWLKALQKHGLDVTYAQAGRAFADTEYGLAHANNTGRENVRAGIDPPLSGHPKNTRHADDIDFQIEADVLGMICPGLPRESNRLCDVFGHIMNYGDGVYGGMFVAGMYAAAYFENADVEKVVHAGLACIPEKSLYHQCISDTIRWYHENPDNWKATWRLLEDKWQDDMDCVPGKKFNIDARINGAYIVVGLLYGRGDLARTLEIATLCGQDSDCNPSNAAGVLGCMKGFRGLPAEYTAGFPALAAKTFANSDLTFDGMIAGCKPLAEAVIRRAGGEVTTTAYQIPLQTPEPAPLEQWENQQELLGIAVTQVEVNRWDRRFRIRACGFDLGPGHIPFFADQQNVLLIVPVDENTPAVMEARFQVPKELAGPQPVLHLPISSFGTDGDWVGDFRLKVFADDQPILDKVICTYGKFTIEQIPLPDVKAGKPVDLRIEAHQNEKFHWERAYFGQMEIK